MCVTNMSVTLSSYTRVEMNPDPPFFQTFGNIKQLRYFGILPFKVQTHENGKSTVDTVNWKIQLLLFIVFFTFFAILMHVVYIKKIKSEITIVLLLLLNLEKDKHRWSTEFRYAHNLLFNT